VGYVEFIYEDLTLASEYQLMNLDYTIEAFNTSDDKDIEGYYFLASYRIND